uniref:Septin n=1 Tax=Acrobeloides nanus TaxID=290746 RepID=A0A914C761_9BILA
MVVGQSGLGKSTFINSLFLAEINDPQAKAQFIPSTVKIESKTVCLIENDVRLNVTFVDTPGFGDAVDNSNCWEPIIKYIDDKYADYLAEETKIERPSLIEDHRAHLCLYFIAPTGHGLKPLDLEFMKALQDRVNIVPVIAKADTLTSQELARFKKNIIHDLEANQIKLYAFPEPENLSSNDTKDGTKLVDHRNRIPFAVIGSNLLKDAHGRKVRVREYAWGTVEVENMAHNDFIALRDIIIRSNLIDLIDVTKNVHYENFRIRQMCKMPKGSLDRDPFTQLEQERRTCEKEAEEVRQTKEKIFAEKVAAREHKLAERSRQLDEKEKENRRILDEKRQVIDKLMTENAELRRSTGIFDSGSSIGRASPPEKSKKKGLFNRI